MPIWLIYATGVLEKAGHDCRLIDSPARRQTRIELLREAGFEIAKAVFYKSDPEPVSVIWCLRE